MLYLFFALCLLALLAMLAGVVRNKILQKKLEAGEITELPSVQQINDMECCGQHETCEKESLLAAVSREIEYYNDEELDRFREKASSEYADAEVEEFRDILYTMKNTEVAGWVRSLQLRSVELPDELKDEVVMIISERRSDGHKKGE
ncbi:MAG: phospholipase [Bacteroides sp.]|nr:hypothetical protein [Roseburia sp.]MCM1347138.1 phospholipase [Bacteroides sp.]MCM1420618.1 phospholipase [Bacteroides sp.]